MLDAFPKLSNTCLQRSVPILRKFLGENEGSTNKKWEYLNFWPVYITWVYMPIPKHRLSSAGWPKLKNGLFSLYFGSKTTSNRRRKPAWRRRCRVGRRRRRHGVRCGWRRAPQHRRCWVFGSSALLRSLLKKLSLWGRHPSSMQNSKQQMCLFLPLFGDITRTLA